jgi:acetyl-CoA carboxylase carboxyltransferase component
MTKNSAIFIAGPAFVKAQTGVEIDEKNLGGAEMHSEVSGLIDILEESEKEIFEKARKLIKYLPSSYKSGLNKIENTDERNRCEEKLNYVVPENSKKPFDMRIVINEIVDDKNFFEIKGEYAKNIIIGFARLDGKTVGIVANQPLYLGGLIDIKAAEKAARFVRFCDAFNVPILTFQDSPAYLIGESMERKGIIYKGAKLLYAYAEATVPLVTVIIRKAYAGAYIAMGSQYIGADLVYAWPNAEIGSVGEKTAASILFKNEKKDIVKEGSKEKIENEYFEKYISAFHAASLRHINDIIEPKYTRPILIRSFEILEKKSVVRPSRKHGNIPL